MMSLIVLLTACSEGDVIAENHGSSLHISSVSRVSGDITHVTEGSIKLYVMTEDEKFSEGTFSTGWTNDNNSVPEAMLQEQMLFLKDCQCFLMMIYVLLLEFRK